MTSIKTTLVSALFLVSSGTVSFSQNVIAVNIQKEVHDKNVTIFNREVTEINEPQYAGIKLDAKLEDDVVWLKNMEFSTGTIEFDVRGKNLKQHSFVGVAFHGNDYKTYDAVYLRPFNFQAAEEPWHSRAIQYVSLPANTWRVLREKTPGKYENFIQPVPDPDAWLHMRVVVTATTISAFINDNTSPSLVVETLGTQKTGSVGFFVADTSGGDFANLRITKTK